MHSLQKQKEDVDDIEIEHKHGNLVVGGTVPA